MIPGSTPRRITPTAATWLTVSGEARTWAWAEYRQSSPRGLCRSISDGAAAVVVMSAEAAERAGVRSARRDRHARQRRRADNSLHSQPSNAIRQALAKAGRTISDLDLIEINEAFAIVASQSMRDLNAGHDKVNVNGGAESPSVTRSYPPAPGS